MLAEGWSGTCRRCSWRTAVCRPCGASGSSTVSGFTLSFALHSACSRLVSTCAPHKVQFRALLYMPLPSATEPGLRGLSTQHPYSPILLFVEHHAPGY